MMKKLILVVVKVASVIVLIMMLNGCGFNKITIHNEKLESGILADGSVRIVVEMPSKRLNPVEEFKIYEQIEKEALEIVILEIGIDDLDPVALKERAEIKITRNGYFLCAEVSAQEITRLKTFYK